MPRSRRSLQPLAEGPRIHGDLGGPVWIHVRLPGGKDQVDVEGGGDRPIGLQPARIGFQVGPRLELQGVDEDRDRHEAALAPRGSDQESVTIVQVTERGHESKRLSPSPRGLSRPAELFGRRRHFQSSSTSRRRE